MDNSELTNHSGPAYEEDEILRDMLGSLSTRDDGRVDVDLDSKLARTLSFVTRLPESEEGPIDPPPYTEVAWQVPLNIVIQIVGSRGDVQPFIALGQELQRFGHTVRIATHNCFRDFVKQANLGFYPIGGDPVELMAYMVKNPGLIPKMKTLQEGQISAKRRMIRKILSGCWDACIRPDPDTKEPFVANAIIANPPSFAHIHCAEALGIPVHIMFTMPWTPTQELPHPLACVRPSKVGKGMANYLSYGLVAILTWQGLADVINDFRKSIDLEPVQMTEGPFLSETLTIPHTYCWSPSLVPKPKDWQSHIDVCGFFFRESPNFQPPGALQAFLARGPPPVYIGFGSIVIDDPDQFTDILIEAIRSCGTRAIISAGWSKLGKNLPSEHQDIFVLNDDCPHEWLFPQVAAVVHHGGAGTTACGLVNGKPTAIVPFFGDQFFWGDMIARAGAGPPLIRYKEVTAQNLCAAISFCLSPGPKLKASEIAASMKQENGVAAAVASFHRNLPRSTISCSISPDQPAIWSYRKSGKVIKLSTRTSEALISHGRVKREKLQPYSLHSINIENRRWDPTTAVAASVTGTSIDILKAGNSLWKAPYDTRKRILQKSDCGEVGAKGVAAMVGSSAMGVPRIFGALAKGFIVDIPLALTEGLRSTPRLYGSSVKDIDPIIDWKSGGIVAGKAFATNLQESFSDLCIRPGRGLEKEGIVGFSKEIGKGTIGMFVRSGAAFTGLIAYPAQGIAKSVHSTFHSSTRKAITAARHSESQFRIQRQPISMAEATECLRVFDELTKSKVTR